MWGTKEYYKRARYGNKYDFEYGVACRLGRKLGRYFAMTGSHVFVYTVPDKKWDSLWTSTSRKCLLSWAKRGITKGLVECGSASEGQFIARGLVSFVQSENELFIVYTPEKYATSPDIRGVVFDLQNRLADIWNHLRKVEGRK